MGMARKKSWLCADCRHLKTAFCLRVNSKATSISSYTVLAKRALAKACWALGGTVFLAVKTKRSKQGLSLEATEAKEDVTILVYNPSPQKRIGKEASRH